MTGPEQHDLDAAVAKNLQETIAGLEQSVEEWRKHALRNDSLGECARRKHLRCLERMWGAQEQLAIAEEANR